MSQTYTDKQIQEALQDPAVLSAIQKSISSQKMFPSLVDEALHGNPNSRQIDKNELKEYFNDKSVFLCFVMRMNGIMRWNKSSSIHKENLHEHSVMVACFNLLIGQYRTTVLGKCDYTPEELVCWGLTHDLQEAVSEDVNSLYKNSDNVIKHLVKTVEDITIQKLASTIDPTIREPLKKYLDQRSLPKVVKDITKASDLMSAYAKSLSELRSNNEDFANAAASLRTGIEIYFDEYPEIKHVYDNYIEAFGCTVDQIMCLLPSTSELNPELEEKITSVLG